METQIFREPLSPGSIVSIIYDGYSSAWMIGFAILKEEIEGGSFAIISNYNLPLSGLCRSTKQVGLRIEEELNEDNLVVMDVFGSKYNVKYPRKNVFYVDNVSSETINPKMDLIYRHQIIPLIGGRKTVRLINTLDGAALMFGEMETLKLLNQTIAERLKDVPDSVLILPINRDVVSKKFIGWIAGISDYVITSSVQMGESIEEKIYLVKSPEEGFTSAVYRLWITEEKSPERIKVKRIS